MTKALGWTAFGLSVALSGCMTPRTGEFYQETKSCRIGSWLTLTEAEKQFTYYSLLSVPLKLIFQGVDVAVVNPLWDTFMLPVDAFYPRHARTFRVVDGEGRPVAGASVSVDGMYRGDGWADHTCSTETRDVGISDKDGAFALSRLHRSYRLFDCTVAAEGYHSRRFVLHASGAETAAADPLVLTLDAVRDPIDHPVRSFRLPLSWTTGEQRWSRGYDLAKGAWMPPYGKGEHADMTVETTISASNRLQRVVLRPGESGTGFARATLKPNVDPRFFVTDYEVPPLTDFETEFNLVHQEITSAGALLQVTNPPEGGSALKIGKEYVIYRVRREDGVHVGALVPTLLGWDMRNVWNPVPGSRSLEYR